MASTHDHDLVILLNAIATSCKLITSAVQRAGVAKLYGLAGEGMFMQYPVPHQVVSRTIRTSKFHFVLFLFALTFTNLMLNPWTWALPPSAGTHGRSLPPSPAVSSALTSHCRGCCLIHLCRSSPLLSPNCSPS